MNASETRKLSRIGRSVLGAVWLALALSGTACQTDAEPTDMGGSGGGGTDEGLCGTLEEALSVEAGTLSSGPDGGATFIPFSTDPRLTIISGSQAAPGVPVEFELKNLDLSTVTHVEAKLIVDQAPIGFYEDSDPAFTCTGGSSQYEAMTFIDVTDHPTVNNIIVLDQRDAVLDYKISAGDEILAQDLVTVRLTF